MFRKLFVYLIFSISYLKSNMTENINKPCYKYCTVPMCKNNTKNAPDKAFIHIPRDQKLRKKWCKMMKRTNISPKSTTYCCEDHFNIEEDTENYMEYKIMALQEGQKISLRLKKGILPHIFQCQKGQPQPVPPVRKAALKRERQRIVEVALSEYALKQSSTLEIGQSSQIDYCEAGPSTAISFEMSSANVFHHVNNKVDADVHPFVSPSTVCSKNINVETQIHKAVQVNIKVPYRSKGLNVTVRTNSVALSPFATQCSRNVATSPLKSVHTNTKRKLFHKNLADVLSTSVSPVLSTDYESELPSSETSWLLEDNEESNKEFQNNMRSCTLAAIEKEPKMLLGLPKRSFYLIKLLSENIPLPTIDILITLKKIKLNESFCILALQFGYAQSTISRIFSKSILTIAKQMKELIVWPASSEIFKKLPIAFRARYANVVSIIDCFEIEIEKPSNAVHQSLTWSHYKKCNTLKYLISCTPDGLVNFISDGYGGRATDVMIVKDCGYLQYLPTNKAVMADRGFKDLSCLLENKKCKLVRPPSVFKSTLSTKEDVKQSKRIAALRIHVERVISRLREFHLLLPHACVDHNLISVIDEVIIVACGLINLQEVIIKK